MTKLTPKQQAFVAEYLIDLNATQSAIRAGYSAKTANEQGARLLANVSVRQAIQNDMDKRAARVGRAAEDVLRDIQTVKNKCMATGYDKDGNESMIDAKAALKALELEGRHLKMFTERIEVDFSGEIAVRLKEARERVQNR